MTYNDAFEAIKALIMSGLASPDSVSGPVLRMRVRDTVDFLQPETVNSVVLGRDCQGQEDIDYLLRVAREAYGLHYTRVNDAAFAILVHRLYDSIAKQIEITWRA